MKFDCSNKFDFCYYGQVNSLQLKSSVVSKWASKRLWSNIYFAGGGTLDTTGKSKAVTYAFILFECDDFWCFGYDSYFVLSLLKFLQHYI